MKDKSQDKYDLAAAFPPYLEKDGLTTKTKVAGIEWIEFRIETTT